MKRMIALFLAIATTPAFAGTTKIKLNDEQLGAMVRSSIGIANLVGYELIVLRGNTADPEAVRCMRIGQLSEQTNILFVISQNSNFSKRKYSEYIIKNIVDMKDFAQGLKGYCGIQREDSFARSVQTRDRQQLEMSVHAILMAASNILHMMNP